MRRVSRLLAALSLAATAVLAGNVVEAVKVNADLLKLKCGSKVIMKNAKFSEIVVYPQKTVTLNDKKANEINKNSKAKKVEVAALYDGKNVAVIVRWPDKTKNIQKGYKSDIYADGFAVQFANKPKDVNKLPYIGMGSKNRPVVIYLQKAVEKVYEPNGNGVVGYQVNPHNTNRFGKDLEKFEKRVEQLAIKDYQRAFISEGFRSMTEIKDNSAKYSADMHYVGKKGGMWGGMVVRPLKDSYLNLNSGAFPVAVAIWDGEKLNRDGLKHLSGWIAVKLPNGGGTDLVKATNEIVKGDVKKGKELALTNCASCHRWRGAEQAPMYMAPDLSNIGGQATAGYIRESIVDPNAVIVPGYNRNSHPNFAWYSVDDKGNRTSVMPPFDWMDKKSLDDLVAYMQTLKAEVEK
ncbi:ethylbenzene dehydrogenase-related protein [Nitrosophilus kaiyonis]|uniref:ethylbenzene dehydrogenase-related protein n=1 Tax=Nitrosophilus kaiyonis TaxID=2930200 RepID=UPI0024904DAE|nr:ethylbenzene dehydrogenase-related protein [Nitrosophilus kaiyonis]